LFSLFGISNPQEFEPSRFQGTKQNSEGKNQIEKFLFLTSETLQKKSEGIFFNLKWKRN